jgi:hypothetical protein
MRKLYIAILAFVAVVAAIAIYIVATTPSHGTGVRFPLTESQRALVARVPQSAEAFAFVPAAAVLEGKLRANPITRDAVESWEEKHSIPARWLLGGADVLLWRDADGGTHYLVQADPLRSLFVRNEEPGPPLEAAERDTIMALAAGLPPGDAFVVQRARSRGAFPPISRPAVTSLSVSKDFIEMTSIGRGEAHPTGGRPVTFAQGAMLSAVFADPPRVVDDLNRLFGTKVSPLLANGGSITIYDVDSRKLLPRPRGVIAVPGDDQRRAAFQEIIDRARVAETIGVQARTGERDGQLLLSFDDSIDTYLKDAMVPGRWPAGRWAVRMDAQRLAPVVRQLSESLGLRVAAPRLFRSARDLDKWIGGLEQASTIEAADSDDGASEVLRVRITAK